MRTNFGMKDYAGVAVIGLALAWGAAGCKSNAPTITTTAADGTTNTASLAGDPAAINSCATSGTTGQPVQGQVLGAQSAAPASQYSSEEYPQQAAPTGGDQSYAYNNPDYDNQVAAGEQALYADQPPPPLPEYEQPVDTDPNDLWTPGYWSYGSSGYYWVPGAWVAPPYSGALWTPGYWGYYGHRYGFHHGYWGLHIGFYGGIPYGFGYTGYGYSGGYWNGSNFYYNRSVNRIDSGRIRNVYNYNVRMNNNYGRVSYNGGNGGIPVRPRPNELAVLREPRVPARQAQRQAAQMAGQNRQQFFAENHGRPAMAVAARPYQADRVNPPAQLARVQQENQQRLEQMRAPQQNQQRPFQQQQVNNQQREQQMQQQQRGQQENLQRQQQVVNQQRGQQQQEQQRNQQVQEQQRNQQVQQQRNVQEQQRTQQMNQQRVQQQAVQQRQQQQIQQQRNVMQQRNVQEQQRQQVRPQETRPVQENRPQQVAPRPQENRPQPAPQSHPQAPHPQPQSHPAPPPHEGGHPKR